MQLITAADGWRNYSLRQNGTLLILISHVRCRRSSKCAVAPLHACDFKYAELLNCLAKLIVNVNAKPLARWLVKRHYVDLPA